MRILRYFLIFMILGMGSGTLLGQQIPHALAVVQKGDGVIKLLNRYRINTPCNSSYFYQINGLSKNQGLKVGKSYFLPVLVYQYNGRSIRSTTGIEDMPWAQSVQKFNELIHQSGLKNADYRQDGLLWVPYHMLYCPSETVDWNQGNNQLAFSGPAPQPAAVQIRGDYPIFGDKYSKVPLESNDLRGCVYYIVSGHGGPDPGAVGNYRGHSLCEDEYAYDVALRLAWNLLSYGATVYIITRDQDDGIREGEILPCDKDEICWINHQIPINQSERLTQRSDAVNRLYKRNKKQGVNYQRLIVIHVDSDNQSEKIDMFFYHKIGDRKSKRFASNIHQTIGLKYDQYRKGRGYTGTVTSRDLHMLRETEPVATFIELGNIKNRNDQARLVIEGNRQLVANWLFEGIILDVRR